MTDQRALRIDAAGNDGPVEPGQAFEIGLFRPDDAPGVVRLFREIYGEYYPYRHFYDVGKLVEMFRNGTHIPVVARTPNGDVVGYAVLHRSAPYSGLYEAAQGLTLPGYRQRGITTEIARYCEDRVVPALEAGGVFGEAVCNHIYTQKVWGKRGFAPCALGIDLMPAETYRKEGSAGGRVTVLSMFRTLRSKPQTIYTPLRYEEAIRFIYSGFDDPRDMVLSYADALPGPKTVVETEVMEFGGAARVAVPSAGGDLHDALLREEERVLNLGVTVIEISLRLTCPGIGAIVDDLWGLGYFFGGVQPRWFDDDAILMQKIVGTPNWEGIDLYDDRPKKILDYVMADWETKR
jgi:hypothetical protein